LGGEECIDDPGVRQRAVEILAPAVLRNMEAAFSPGFAAADIVATPLAFL
jgi:hypothetical protein